MGMNSRDTVIHGNHMEIAVLETGKSVISMEITWQKVELTWKSTGSNGNVVRIKLKCGTAV